MARRIHALVVSAALASAGCPEAPPATPAEVAVATHSPPPSAAARAVDDEAERVTFVGVARPPMFALDGDLAEWGKLEPPPKTPPKDGKAPPPERAPSHVAIAIDATGVTLAADLASASADGIWLRLSAAASEVPPIGSFQRGGGVRPFDCENEQGGEPLSPAEADACRKWLAGHDAFVARYTATFERVLRLDKDGVKLLGPNGGTTAIRDAKAATKVRAGGLTLEAKLPLSVLPEVTAAPITWFNTSAVPATRAPDFGEKVPVRSVELPEPLAIEPLGAIRARAFEAAMGNFARVPMSYAPGGDPGMLHVVWYVPGSSGAMVEATERRLWSPMDRIGSVEVGWVFTGSPSVGVVSGKDVQIFKMNADPIAVVKRGKELHVFAYSEGVAGDTGLNEGRWDVLAVPEKGEVREGIMMNLDNPMLGAGDVVESFHDKTFSSFGLRLRQAYGVEGEKGKFFEITYRYDAKVGAYAPTTRPIPEPPKKTRKPKR